MLIIFCLGVNLPPAIFSSFYFWVKPFISDSN